MKRPLRPRKIPAINPDTLKPDNGPANLVGEGFSSSTENKVNGDLSGLDFLRENVEKKFPWGKEFVIFRGSFHISKLFVQKFNFRIRIQVVILCNFTDFGGSKIELVDKNWTFRIVCLLTLEID